MFSFDHLSFLSSLFLLSFSFNFPQSFWHLLSRYHSQSCMAKNWSTNPLSKHQAGSHANEMISKPQPMEIALVGDFLNVFGTRSSDLKTCENTMGVNSIKAVTGAVNHWRFPQVALIFLNCCIFSPVSLEFLDVNCNRNDRKSK